MSTYRTVEVGNLYQGDTVLLPGDIAATVTGFDFDESIDVGPGYIGIMFAGFKAARLYAMTDLVEVEVRS